MRDPPEALHVYHFIMSLLPPGNKLGWTPYAWLVYLGFFLMYPIVGNVSSRVWLTTVVGVVIFLTLYFRAFWAGTAELLLIIAAITALGVIFAPSNPGASSFFIYAAAFACETGQPRRALAVIGLIVGVCLVESWLLDLPPWFWIPATVIGVVVGGVNIHWTERRRAEAHLRRIRNEMAAVAERERIARDLHDLLGHNLSMITLKTELASKLFERDPEKARMEIREVEAISRETLGRVREAVTGFRSRGLREEAEMVKQNLASAGIETELTIDPPTLGQAGENVVALFLREAGTNIIRHAGAKKAWIEIAQSDGRCEIEVRDDGRGEVREEGFGIRGMRTRIEAIGGTLDVASENGTTVHASIPLPGEAV